MGGTFWMHAHVHEHTEEQVSGGAYAMLIIEENNQVVEDPSIDAGPIAEWYNNELLLLASKVGNTVLGNGLSNYVISMNKNEWYRMRIAAADPSRSNDLVFPNGCTVHAAAHDGVWRFQVPKQAASNTYSLSGASRLDVAIKCSSGGSITFGGRNNDVATLSVGSESSSTAYPFTSNGMSWASYRPHYLRDLSGMSSGSFETYSIGMTAAQINGVTYNPDVPLGTWDYGTLQEWTISGTNAHPYHLHVYHMQAVDCDGGMHDPGEYYDTINVNSACVVRFHMIDVGGSVMMHCHFLAHEDNGSMTWANVVNGPTQSSVGREQQTCSAVSPTDPPTATPTNAPTSTPTDPPTATPTKAPTPTPTITPAAPTTTDPTPSPTDAPTPAPVAGSCSDLGESCVSGGDCCSGMCTSGRPATRVCFDGTGRNRCSHAC